MWQSGRRCVPTLHRRHSFVLYYLFPNQGGVNFPFSVGEISLNIFVTYTLMAPSMFTLVLGMSDSGVTVGVPGLQRFFPSSLSRARLSYVLGQTGKRNTLLATKWRHNCSHTGESRCFRVLNRKEQRKPRQDHAGRLLSRFTPSFSHSPVHRRAQLVLLF